MRPKITVLLERKFIYNLIVQNTANFSDAQKNINLYNQIKYIFQKI